jgi:hypothetical protein
MTFALYRYGTLIERRSTYKDCLVAAVKRGLAGSIMGDPELCSGVEILDETGQADLEEAIERAKPKVRV